LIHEPNFIGASAFPIAALAAPTVANSEQLQPNSEGHTELRYRAKQSSPMVIQIGSTSIPSNVSIAMQ
jgi:hypothetical protein